MTSLSRCHTPYAASSRERSASGHYFSRSDFQMMTWTAQVSSSSDMKMTPLAVSGCCPSVAMPAQRAKRPLASRDARLAGIAD
jgi:hypothetical protein